jgi:cytochrome c oxidase subunit 5a
MSFVRAFSRVNRTGIRVPTSRARSIAWKRAFSVSAARYSDPHAEETFEEFTARYDRISNGRGRPQALAAAYPRTRGVP